MQVEIVDVMRLLEKIYPGRLLTVSIGPAYTGEPEEILLWKNFHYPDEDYEKASVSHIFNTLWGLPEIEYEVGSIQINVPEGN